jgi:hypothetical protein
MKAFIGKFPFRLSCKIFNTYMNKKYNYKHPAEQSKFEDFLEILDDKIQDVYNVLNTVYFDKRERKIKVKIHGYDIWSMDDTLAHVILPMLKVLRENKDSYSFVDNSDVPEELQTIKLKDDFSDDPKAVERWYYILDEMIFSFDSKITDFDFNSETKFNEQLARFKFDKEGMDKHQKRISNGFRLFGKYYEALWT